MPFDQLQAPRPLTGRDRLRILADFLLTVPPERFNIRTWGHGGFEHECGTAACAFGWAATIPAFRELGLHHVRLPGGWTMALGDYQPENGFAVARKFFELDGTTTQFFFSPLYYRTFPRPSDVSARIYEYLGDHAISRADLMVGAV